jgi:nitrogen regulatory protein P-II 1
MKLITVITRPGMLDELIGTAIAHGARGMTVTEVRGFGQQYGQHTSRAALAGWPPEPDVALLPKVRVEIAADDSCTGSLVQAIAKQVRTGVIGDGKIWVSTLDSVLRVRTGEQDSAAL